MTLDEAKAILGIAQIEDAEDAFEERLFELKQYFLTKPLISKLFLSQLNKIERVFAAARYFGLSGGSNKLSDSPAESVFQGLILNDYLLFEKFRAAFKQEILGSLNDAHINHCVHRLLAVQQSYLLLWPENTSEEVLISKEPDPMEVLLAIKELNEQEVFRFDQLHGSTNALPDSFVNEWKRLSLLLQKEGEWKKISSEN
jgi:hypothetical protein